MTAGRTTKKRIKGPFNFKGMVFAYLKDAAEYFGVPKNTVSVRLRDGWTLEEALGLSPRNPSKFAGIPVTINGTRYKSVKAASAALNIDYKLVHSRLERGLSIEEAFGLKSFEYSSKPKTVVVGGRRFSSLRDACKHYGVDKDVLSGRINRLGWTLEQALGQAPRPAHNNGAAGLVYLVTNTKTGKRYIGVTMAALSQRWKQHIEKSLSGKKVSTLSLHHDMKVHGIDNFTIDVIAEASSVGELNDLEVQFVKKYGTLRPNGYNLNVGGAGTRTKGIRIEVGGKTFASITAACREFKVDRRLATQRLSTGWTAEQVFLKAPRISKKSIQIKYRGTTYESETALCQAYGVNTSSFWKRKKEGKSLDECLGVAPDCDDRKELAEREKQKAPRAVRSP